MVACALMGGCKKLPRAPRITLCEESDISDGDVFEYSSFDMSGTVRFKVSGEESYGLYVNCKFYIDSEILDEKEYYANDGEVLDYHVEFGDIGDYTIVIRATDFYRQTASAILRFKVSETPTPPEPPTYSEVNIQILNGEGFVSDNDTVNLHQWYKFGFYMSGVDESVSLRNLVVDIDGALWADVDLDGCSYSYIDSVFFEYDGKGIVGQCVITATATDADGCVATAAINLVVKSLGVPLASRPFLWNKHGEQPGTGLAEYGLQWTNNGKEVFAEIRPVPGATLYEFSPEVWNAINTVEAKNSLFITALETGVPINLFNKVSALTSHDDYNFVLGTIMPDGSLHLIHITQGAVENYEEVDITINGEAK